jgi:hypothetical protein
MANLDVRPKVFYPSEPEIRLVRADFLDASNNARIGFEIALSLFSALVGAHLSSKDPVPVVHWLFEIVMGMAAAAFLVWSVTAARRARDEAKATAASP